MSTNGTPVIRSADHRKWPIITDDDKRAVQRALDRGILSGSYAPEARAFEEEFGDFVSAKHCLLTHCGTSALQVALASVGIKDGDEVLVPAYSFVATPLAVSLQGGVPIFVDVDAATGLFDLALAEAKVSERTRALMPVHVHGQALDMDAVTAFAKKHKLAIVEDAAQAHGAKCGGTPVGAIGDAGGFSLQSSKNLSAGEGGIFVTNKAENAEIANRVRNFGQNLSRAEDAADFDEARPLDGKRSLVSSFMGSMFRGNEMMAAFARSQLKRLPELTAQAQANADRLSKKLAELPGVTPPMALANRTSVHHKYRVHLDPVRAGLPCSPKVLRDSMIAALRAEGCEVVMWQSVPLPAHPIYGESAQDYPATQALLDGSLLLFSQSCPLIAQSAALVDRYAEAFAKVWAHRERMTYGR